MPTQKITGHDAIDHAEAHEDEGLVCLVVPAAPKTLHVTITDGGSGDGSSPWPYVPEFTSLDDAAEWAAASARESKDSHYDSPDSEVTIQCETGMVTVPVWPDQAAS